MNKPMRLATPLLAFLLSLASVAAAADITGSWQVTIMAPAADGTTQSDTGLALLKQTGESITGSVGQDQNRQNPITDGIIKDNKVTFKVSPRPDRTMTFDLTISGDKLVGTVERSGDLRKGTVEFVKSAPK